MLAIEVVLLL